MKKVLFVVLMVCLSSQAYGRGRVAEKGRLTFSEGPVMPYHGPLQQSQSQQRPEIVLLQSQGLSHEDVEVSLTLGSSMPHQVYVPQSLPPPNGSCDLDYNNVIQLGQVIAEQAQWSNPPNQPSDFVYADAYCDWGNWNKSNCRYSRTRLRYASVYS